MANYSSREDVILSLNDIPNITAEYKPETLGKGFIAITMDEDEVDADDILSLGAYIGQIETMSHVNS